MITNEKISALIDRQASASERRALFERMRADCGARETWRRYHLIGLVLRGEISHCGADLSARICARLEAEPAPRAPLQSARPVRKPLNRWALAASLAALLALLALAALRPPSQDGAHIAVRPDARPDARVEQEFHVMLMQHGEFASSPRMNGLLVYAKLLSDQPLHTPR
ncbi:MAG: sigma-E factor negative regulatory protein [Gammaproteobacteria bacterium]